MHRWFWHWGHLQSHLLTLTVPLPPSRCPSGVDWLCYISISTKEMWNCISQLLHLNQERAKVSMGLVVECWENLCRNGCVEEKGCLRYSVNWVSKRTESLLAQPEFFYLPCVPLSLPPEGCLPYSESTRKWRGLKWRGLVPKIKPTSQETQLQKSLSCSRLYFKTLGIFCDGTA